MSCADADRMDTAPWLRHSRPDAGLLLRPATTSDVGELAALKRRVETRCYAHLGSPEALAVRLRERCTAWHLLTLMGEGHLVLVAELHREVVGLAAARVEHQNEAPALRLHSAYVERPGYGAGQALTAARLDAAANLGIEQVVASSLVGAHSAGKRLRRLGLVPDGPSTPCPTFPGVGLAHWRGSLGTALRLAGSSPSAPDARVLTGPRGGYRRTSG